MHVHNMRRPLYRLAPRLSRFFSLRVPPDFSPIIRNLSTVHHIYDLDFRVIIFDIRDERERYSREREREREIEERYIMVNTRKIMRVRYGVNLERFMLCITLRVEFFRLEEIG